MHETFVSVQIKVSIPEDKKITIGNLATTIHNIGIEKKVTEEVILNLSDKITSEYCGQKYARGNGDERYQRAGTKCKHPVTCVGALDLRLNRIRDTHTTNNMILRPIEDILMFDGENIYQEDISMIAVELSTKMTYRDTKIEGELFTKMPSVRTINRRTIKYGKTMQDYNNQEIEGLSADIAIPDATKSHSQEKDRSKNDINVTLTVQNGKTVLLDTRVNKSWKEASTHLDDVQALAKDATIIGDGDPEMNNALVTEEREFQMDLVHMPRATGYKLWADSMLSFKEREEIMSDLKEIQYTLKNSVKKHVKDGDLNALRRRIEMSVDAFKKMADDLQKVGCYKAAKFINKFSNYCVTFARLAIDGRKIPWNSNVVERLMGEISKRCKHKWMRWTTEGQEAILNIILIRYTSKEKYDRFKKRITYHDNLKYINCEVNILIDPG